MVAGRGEPRVFGKQTQSRFLPCHEQCAWGGGRGWQLESSRKIVSSPRIVEMINHLRTKERKGRFVKNKQGTECQLRG